MGPEILGSDLQTDHVIASLNKVIGVDQEKPDLVLGMFNVYLPTFCFASSEEVIYWRVSSSHFISFNH